MNYVLSLLIYTQRVDAQMSSVNMEDYISTMDYFFELVDPFLGDTPQEMVDAFHEAVRSIPPVLQGDAHRIMREACEGVHEIIKESRGVDAYETAVRVYDKMNQELNRFADLIEDASGDEFLKLLRVSKVNGQVVKEPAGKSGDYEVVG